MADRELNTRIKISEALAKKGFLSIVGPKDLITTYALKGINKRAFLDKGFDIRSSPKFFFRLNKLKVNIFSLDEEGAIDIKKLDFLNRRYPKILFKYCSIVFFWGNAQLLKYGKNGKTNCKKIVSGHPRFDKVRSINYNRNKTITICTNFGWANNISGEEWIIKNYKSRINCVEDLIGNDKIKIQNTLKLIKKLCDFNNPIIIRIHHEENINTWKKLIKEFKNKNITIDNSSNISDILKDSLIVFHCDSTVAIDSQIRGLPTFSYLSDKLDKDLLCDIPIKASCYIDENLLSNLNSVDEILDFYRLNKRKDDTLSNYFNLTDNSKEPVISITEEIYSILRNKKDDSFLIFILNIIIYIIIDILKIINNKFLDKNLDGNKVYKLKHKYFWKNFKLFTISRNNNKKNIIKLKIGRGIYVFQI